MVTGHPTLQNAVASLNSGADAYVPSIAENFLFSGFTVAIFIFPSDMSSGRARFSTKTL